MKLNNRQIACVLIAVFACWKLTGAAWRDEYTAADLMAFAWAALILLCVYVYSQNR